MHVRNGVWSGLWQELAILLDLIEATQPQVLLGVDGAKRRKSNMWRILTCSLACYNEAERYQPYFRSLTATSRGGIAGDTLNFG